MNKNELQKVKEEMILKLSKINDMKDLNDLKVSYLGKKGIITELSLKMKEVSLEDKKEFGILLNDIRGLFNDEVNKLKEKLELDMINKKLESDAIDITLPSSKLKRGSLHPVTKIRQEMEDIFVSMGYDVVDGPEVESDMFNFELLNLPKGHPARDSQDSFYITSEMLLRTHTSPMQARTMQAYGGKKPIRIICPGKTYRRDDDATHSHQFMQIEGLVVDKGISLADLKGTLETLFKKLFGENTKVRFRASYFPFTEPSYEADITCFKCGGKGCNLCKKTGFIEVLGSGMVHPNVLKMNGYDPEVYSGFAFGIGIERMAMFKYDITDIRHFYTNDIRFLNTFDRKGDE